MLLINVWRLFLVAGHRDILHTRIETYRRRFSVQLQCLLFAVNYSLKILSLLTYPLLSTARFFHCMTVHHFVTKCKRRCLMSPRGHEPNTYLILAFQNSEVFKVSIEVWIIILRNRKWGNTSILKLFEYDVSLVYFFSFNIPNS